VIELIRRYQEVLRKRTHDPDADADAELEKIYMEALRQNPQHRLVKLHELMMEGVSINITEQVRDLLAEEITSLDPISRDKIE